jgi:hypothetical protein
VLTAEGLPSGRAGGALSWSGRANTYWVVDRKKVCCPPLRPFFIGSSPPLLSISSIPQIPLASPSYFSLTFPRPTGRRLRRLEQQHRALEPSHLRFVGGGRAVDLPGSCEGGWCIGSIGIQGHVSTVCRCLFELLEEEENRLSRSTIFGSSSCFPFRIRFASYQRHCAQLDS